MKITVGVDAELPAFDRRHEPVTVGVACARGRVDPEAHWSLFDPRGRRCPVQATTLDRWSDGSVRWALLDFQADARAGEQAVYTLESGADAAWLPAEPLRLEAEADSIVVTTGPARFHLARTGHSLLADVEVAGQSVFPSGAVQMTAQDASGRDLVFNVNRAIVERTGPVRVVIRTDGQMASADGRSLLDVTARSSFYAGLSTMQVELSMTNPRAARHRDGCWDLGDPGSVLLRRVTMRFAPSGLDNKSVRCSAERTAPLSKAVGPLEIYQDSSGGENWQHINHVNRLGRVPATFRGYHVVGGGAISKGLRGTPVVTIGSGARQLTVAMRHFWENFPKAIVVDDDGITVGLWPEQYGDLHELQGGERKTHTLAFCVGPDTVSDDPLFWVRSPLVAVVDPASYADAGAWAPIHVGSDQARSDYDALVSVAMEGAASFRERRECIDEYGWRNFGELYADHESVGSDTPLVSHYNNQYDALAGFITRFLATGERQWRRSADELAAHVSDIDIYHARDDRAAYSGGSFWHTVHYAPASTATHRAYSHQTGLPGGGPSNEHNYTTGLMLHYFLTGSDRSREAVLELAEWVLDMDDGTKSRFRWLDAGDTGLASSTRSPDYHGPGRGSGNSINTLLDAHRLTGDPRFLKKADQLVRR